MMLCGLRNRWIKPDKWHLGRKRGSLRFYLTGFGLDPTPLGCRIEGKQKELFAAIFQLQILTLCNYT